MNGTTTWADGLGRWHAAVPWTGCNQADAALARAAIQGELNARGEAGDGWRLHVKRYAVTSDGTAEYGEV